MNLARHMDPFVETCFGIILKRCSDTNVFLAESSRFALEEYFFSIFNPTLFFRLCLNCNESKLLPALLNHSDSKSPLIKSQLSRCFEQLILKLGFRLLSESHLLLNTRTGDNWDRIL